MISGAVRGTMGEGRQRNSKYEIRNDKSESRNNIKSQMLK